MRFVLPSFLLLHYARKERRPGRIQILIAIALTLTGIIINGVSISIAAITSLDWKKQTTHDKAFELQLLKLASQVSYVLHSVIFDHGSGGKKKDWGDFL